MASRRKRLQRSQSTLTAISISSVTNSATSTNAGILKSGGSSNTLSSIDNSSSPFQRIFKSLRGKSTTASDNASFYDKFHQYSWKYATWSTRKSKSMCNVKQSTASNQYGMHNRSMNEADLTKKENFGWSNTSGVKIIRSLSDLNQALGKFKINFIIHNK